MHKMPAGLCTCNKNAMFGTTQEAPYETAARASFTGSHVQPAVCVVRSVHGFPCQRIEISNQSILFLEQNMQNPETRATAACTSKIRAAGYAIIMHWRNCRLLDDDWIITMRDATFQNSQFSSTDLIAQSNFSRSVFEKNFSMGTLNFLENTTVRRGSM